MIRFTCSVCGKDMHEAGQLSKRVGKDDGWLCPEHFNEKHGKKEKGK